MASDSKVTKATIKLGKQLTKAFSDFAREVGADDLANEISSRVKEGLDMVAKQADRARGAANRVKKKAKKTASRAKSTAKKTASKVRANRPTRKKKTTRRKRR